MYLKEVDSCWRKQVFGAGPRHQIAWSAWYSCSVSCVLKQRDQSFHILATISSLVCPVEL